MSYLTQYYKNKSIMLQEQVTNLENVLNFIKENPDYCLQEDWREKLAKLFGKNADDAAKAASRPWHKYLPSEWPKLPKDIQLKFLGQPITWTKPSTGVTKQYILKVIKGKTRETDVYEVYQWHPEHGWLRQTGGESPWGKVGKVSGHPTPPAPGMIPQPNGGWQNASATLSSNVGDSGSVRQFMNQNNTGNAEGDDETITV